MRLGKLTNEELQSLLGKNEIFNSEVKVSSKIGEDCALISSDDFIVVTTDPITAIVDDIGYQAINVCVNDVVSSGAVPFAALVTILAPSNATVEDVKIVNEQLVKNATDFKIDIIGGHTEFTDAVNRILVSVSMFGRCKKFISSSNLKVGQGLYVTDYVAKEGTGILLTQKQHELLEVLSVNETVEAYALGKDISVYQEGLILSSVEGVSAMHDITEGGIFGAVAEICSSSSVGANILVENIPLHDVTKKICNALNVNPYKLISSGSLLFSVDRDSAVDVLKEKGVGAVKIGEIVSGNKVTAIYDDHEELITTEKDEIYNI